MKKNHIFVLMLIFAGCKQSYDPPVKTLSTGFLVVEGFINSGSTPTTIHLSRTTKLSGTSDVVNERDAQVQIVGDAGDHFELTETASGMYTASPQTLDPAKQYHLHITTSNGKEYVSDPELLKATPPVDSLSWGIVNNGVQVYANTHDPNNLLKYYLWSYDETWEFHSVYASNLKFARDANNGITGLDYRLADKSIDSSIFKCWKSQSSSTILLGSSEKLSSAVIALQPIRFIQPAAIQLSVLYSINVKQYALGQKAYAFYQQLKTNTEQLGTIFDAQPSGTSGNIHCVSNPAELVVGYVEVTAEQTKRLFIANTNVPGWGYDPGCTVSEIQNNEDAIRNVTAYSPIVPDKLFGVIILSFYASENICVDCTLSGSNIKPDFWP